MYRTQKNLNVVDVGGIVRPMHDSRGCLIGGGDADKETAFWNWAGDTKITDELGRPLVVFHGTKSEIDRFESNKATEKDVGWYGSGIYFTADPESASAYSGFLEEDIDSDDSPHVIPVYISLKNPYIWPKNKAIFMSSEESTKFTIELINAGYDGVVVSNEYAEEKYADHYEVIAFRPEQIKSATGNPGSYCRGSMSITDSDVATPNKSLVGKHSTNAFNDTVVTRKRRLSF